jgi:hypothetical protein
MTWSITHRNAGVALFGVHFADSSNGTAVGSQGTILRTTDAGALWTSQASGIADNLYAVVFSDAQTGTAVGQRGTILRTIDEGRTWQRQSSNTIQDLFDVVFFDAYNGIVVGGDPVDELIGGIVLYTNNGGASWIFDESGTANDLYSVSLPNTKTIFVAGLAGTVLRRFTPLAGFALWEPAVKPEQFTLYANYPNPVTLTRDNALTTISYNLHEQATVSLEIYDLLGQRVRALLNRTQPRGFYHVRWDGRNDAGENIAPGIYFYRLKVKDFVQTRKMVLVQ